MKYFIIIIAVLSSFIAFSNDNNPKSAAANTIQVKVRIHNDPGIEKEIKLQYWPVNYINGIHNGEEMRADLSGNGCEFIILATDKPVYLKIFFTKAGKQRQGKIYIAGPGDQIVFQVGNTDESIETASSPKIKTQDLLYNYFKLEKDQLKIVDRRNVDHSKIKFDSFYTKIANELRLRKDQFSELEFQLLNLDWEGLVYNEFLNTLLMQYMISADAAYKKEIASLCSSFLAKTPSSFNAGNTLLAQSRTYGEYVFDREMAIFDMGGFAIVPLMTTIQPGLLASIKTKYNGLFRDKLITTMLLKYDVWDKKNKVIEDAFSLVSGNPYKEILEEVYTRKGMGSKAYTFTLTDTAGKMKELSDFKGKIIIADFWFTGCTACARLNTAMSPVFKRFEKDPQVVFLSISIDKDPKAWKKSILKGEYSGPESIHLYTNGKSIDHPLIKYYDIYSFPKLLIIDQQGTIITTKPPRPAIANEESAKSFIELIEHYRLNPDLGSPLSYLIR